VAVDDQDVAVRRRVHVHRDVLGVTVDRPGGERLRHAVLRRPDAVGPGVDEEHLVLVVVGHQEAAG
jgi:hypothetical protein